MWNSQAMPEKMWSNYSSGVDLGFSYWGLYLSIATYIVKGSFLAPAFSVLRVSTMSLSHLTMLLSNSCEFYLHLDGQGQSLSPLTAIHLYYTKCNWLAPFLDYEFWRIDPCWFCSVWGCCLVIDVQENKAKYKLESRNALPDYRLTRKMKPGFPGYMQKDTWDTTEVHIKSVLLASHPSLSFSIHSSAPLSLCIYLQNSLHLITLRCGSSAWG